MKLVRHVKNKKLYLKLLKTKVKVNNNWVEAIIYMCLYRNKDGYIWTRLIEDFIRCCKGKQKQCGGFTFKYITNENVSI